MTPSERRLRQRLKSDFIHYAGKCLKICSKDGRIVPLVLNTAQQFIHQRLEEQLLQEGRVRAVILKGRQQGCSTYVEGRFYWKVTHRKGVRAFILTHLDAASRNIYQIARRFHDHCPPPVRPHTSLINSRELVFDRLDSGYSVGTARAQGIGRSHTLQYFHGSEVAFWPDAEEHVSGILQAVPDMPGTEIILESTSAGDAGLFYTLAQGALHGNSGFRFIFVPWFWQDEYRRAPSDGFRLTQEEEDYAATFGLDATQMCWRRAKISELGSVWTFRREYPSTVEEAFDSGAPGTLWTRDIINKNRRHSSTLPDMRRIIVAVDPAVSSNEKSDETGIIVAGLGTDGHAYILEDLSGAYPPADWARRVIEAYHTHKADRVVAETNQGGDLVELALRSFDHTVSYRSVHASRGKIVRAEPVAALDADGRIHHAGHFPLLEDQMCRFNPAAGGASPDRVDARVWAITDLMLGQKQGGGPRVWGN